MSRISKVVGALLFGLLWVQPVWAQIGRDGSALLTLDNPTSGGTYTRAYTAGSGSNRALVAACFGAGNPGGDTMTDIKYGGVSFFSTILKGNSQNDREFYIAYLLGNASGNNNLVVSLNIDSAFQCVVSDYHGVAQSAQPDNSQQGCSGCAGGTISLSYTISTTDWIVQGGRDNAGNAATWGGGLSGLQEGGGLHLADSNGNITSNTTTTFATSGSTTYSAGFALKQVGGGGGCTAPPNGLTLIGVGNCKGD